MGNNKPITGRWRHIRTGLIFEAYEGAKMKLPYGLKTPDGKRYIPCVIYWDVTKEREAVRCKADFLNKFEKIE